MSLVPRRRNWHLPLYFPSSGNCKEQWDHYQPLLLQARYTRCSLPLLIGEAPPCHTFTSSVNPSLEAFKDFGIFFILWSPELHTLWWSCISAKRSGRIVSADWLALQYLTHPQNAVCLLGCQGALIAYSEPAVTSTLRSLPAELLSSHWSPRLCLVLVHSKCSNCHFTLLNFVAVDDHPMLCSV